MKNVRVSGLSVAAFLVMAFAAFEGCAVAEEGTIKAMAPWGGQGYVFPIGDDRAYMVAVYSGTMYVEDSKGALHAGSIVCPATVEGNLKTMTKSAQGHCIISNIDGDRVYARFNCTGDMENCRGPFTVESGTGKFAGITGEGEMVSQLESRAAVVVEGFVPARQAIEGIVWWPKLTYKIPETQ